MKSIHIEIPDSVDVSEQELKLSVAAHLYEQQKVSLGEGATIAGISKRFFIENLGKYGLSVFNYDTNVLLQDIANA